MTAWLDAAGRCFNPGPLVQVVPLQGGQCCYVIDNALQLTAAQRAAYEFYLGELLAGRV